MEAILHNIAYDSAVRSYDNRKKLQTEVPCESIHTIKKRINHKLEAFSCDDRSHPVLKKMIGEADRILVSPNAKRIRGIIPALIAEHLSFDIDSCLTYGTAIEIIHFISLIHDDVIDNDSYRRGLPTLNKTFSGKHAVLVADFMLYKVIHYILGTRYDTDVISRFIDAVNDLIAGVIMEQDTMPRNPSLENYAEMVDLKTGSLFGLSFSLPFITDNHFETAMACGRRLGILFQVFDDYQDRNEDMSCINIFHFKSMTEITGFWNEVYSEMLEYSRCIGIEPVISTLMTYLRSYGYSLDISPIQFKPV